MKKRKTCTLSQSRSLKDSQSLSRVQSVNSSTKLSSNRSSYSSKSKRQPLVKNKTNSETKSVNKRETYKSLESLFDLEKPIELEVQNFPYCYPPAEEKKTEVLFKKSYSLDQFGEPNDYTAPLESTLPSLQKNVIEEVLSSEVETQSEKSQAESRTALSEIEEKSVAGTMADQKSENEAQPEDEETPPEEEDQQNEGDQQNEDGVEEDDEGENDGYEGDYKSQVLSSGKSTKLSSRDSPSKPSDSRPRSGRSSIYAPDHPLPLGAGNGIQLKCGQNRDSVMSTIPLAEDCVADEMRKAEERAFCVREEIQELKKILDDLFSKEELSDDDTLILRDTQTAVMEKISELNEITRKLQRTIGLCDPSTQTFARMFEMLPYPHIGMCCPKNKPKQSCDPFKQNNPCGGGGGGGAQDDDCARECTERFAFPQIDYPEDKLPRVIVCGTTEEKFPKIVVADSRPKGCGNKCLQNLTGKLSESLCMQDKLAKENADLEEGKFQLERAVLEKDNAVESLQRKVCGLQAEMRIVVKENCDLSKKLQCLAQNQQQNNSPYSSPCGDSQNSPNSGGFGSPYKQNGSSPYGGQQQHRPCGSPSPKQSPCGQQQQNTGCNMKCVSPCPQPKQSCFDPCAMQMLRANRGSPGPPQQQQPPRLSCGPPCLSPPKPKTSCFNPCAKPSCGSPCPPKPSCFDTDPPQKRPGNSCCPDKPRKPCCPDPAPEKRPPSSRGKSPFGGYGGQQQRLCGGGSQEDLAGKPLRSHRIAGGGCGGGGGGEYGNKLNSFGDNTKHIGEQLSCIENEVRALQCELMNVQRERQQLEQQRKQFEYQGSPGGGGYNSCDQMKSKNQDMNQCGSNDSGQDDNSTLQQLCALREQYARLQDDYKCKLCETSRLRTDLDCLKRETRECKEERERLEIKLDDAQERLKIVETERDCLLGCKEQLVEQEQALLVAKQRYRETQEELEELRSMVRDQACQLDDYRNKYLMAQQQVEEQRRQMDLMEMDNARMNENVTLEIGRVKNQFQEKLAELAPLPEILKQTQIKLQECTQMRMMAEHNCEELSRELLCAKEKMDSMQDRVCELEREIASLHDNGSEGAAKIEELERKNGELRCENERLKAALTRLDELQCQTQKRLDEKQHEIVQLNAMLEQVREDSARQVSRTKERCEAIKKSMQAQICDFEMQLAQCRAAANSAQKERDEIRQKMQGQICNLNESLQQAQGRIKSLQGHVDYLKVSYSNVFSGPPQVDCSPSGQVDLPSTGQGYDSCDCNY